MQTFSHAGQNVWGRLCLKFNFEPNVWFKNMNVMLENQFYLWWWRLSVKIHIRLDSATGKRPVGIPEENRMHFLIKTDQPRGIGLQPLIIPFPNSLHIQVRQWTILWIIERQFRSESDRNKWTTSRGNPEYSGKKKFHLTSDKNLHNGRTPAVFMLLYLNTMED